MVVVDDEYDFACTKKDATEDLEYKESGVVVTSCVVTWLSLFFG